MASCQTTRWAGTSPYVKLVVTENASTSTETVSKLNWAVYYISDYPASASERTYTVKVNGSVPSGGTGSYNINGVTGTKLMASGTVSINKTASTQKITFAVSFPFNLTWSGQYKGTLSASGTVTVSAKPSYTVTYNANGGSNAPGKQTKVHGTNLTLSSGKPTRSGYIFKGWSTTKSGKVEYKPGDTYSSNANITLYAIWQQSTFTVTYNANGGSEAPDDQTKTYDINLTIPSSTIPIKTDYKFIGWGTAASDTTAKYQPGDTYTANANITLYAIWTLDYEKPRITDLSVYRASFKDTFPFIEFTEGGNLGGVSFTWATDKTLTKINISVKTTTSTTWPTYTSIDYKPDSNFIDITSNSDGSQTGTFGGWLAVQDSSSESGMSALEMDPDLTYDVRIIVKDSSGQTTVTRFLNGAVYPIDFLNGVTGTGTAIGKAATLENTFEVGWPTKLTGGLAPVILPDNDLNNILTPGIYTSDNTIVYSNNPAPGTGTFTLEVYAAGNQGQRLQRFTVCHKTDSATYERVYFGNSWGNWKHIYSMPIYDNPIESDKIDYNSSLANKFNGDTPYTETDSNNNNTYYLKYCSEPTGNQNRSYITRNGTVVTMAFRTSSTTNVKAGTAYVLGTIPDSFRPANIVSTSGLFSIGTTVYNSCAIWVRASGQLCVKPYNTSTDGTTKFYEANLTWDLGATGNTWKKTT